MLTRLKQAGRYAWAGLVVAIVAVISILAWALTRKSPAVAVREVAADKVMAARARARVELIEANARAAVSVAGAEARAREARTRLDVALATKDGARRRERLAALLGEV